MFASLWKSKTRVLSQFYAPRCYVHSLLCKQTMSVKLYVYIKAADMCDKPATASGYSSSVLVKLALKLFQKLLI